MANLSLELDMGFFSNRRNRIVEQAITSLVASGRNQADFPQIYFDAARRYAQDHGGEIDREHPDVISFTKRFAGEERFIMFTKMWSGGGTNIDHSTPMNFDDLLSIERTVEEPVEAEASPKPDFLSLTGVDDEDVFDEMLAKCLSTGSLVRAQRIAPAYLRLPYDNLRMSPHVWPIWIHTEEIKLGGGYIRCKYGNCLVLTSVSDEGTAMIALKVDIPNIHAEHREMVEADLDVQFNKWHQLITGKPAPDRERR